MLALALLGDALLYAALPVDAALFGVSAGGVGVLLSANRFVRILAYGAITDIAHRLGPRRLTLLAAVVATVSTLGYSLVRGVGPLLVLRLVWGLAFGALSLTTIVYAVEEPARAGHRLGASRAYTAMGPLVALTIGPFIAARWSSPVAFFVLGTLTALAIPLAASLPRRRATGAALQRAAEHTRWGFLSRRSFLTWWSFSIGFVVDGVFAVSFALLMAGLIPASTALAVTGLVFATRYVAEIVLSPLAGWLGDRVGARRLLRLCSGIVAAGLLSMAIGAAGAAPGAAAVVDGSVPSGATAALWMGAAVVVVARGLLLPLGSAALAATRPTDGGQLDPYRAQGDLAAWRDAGAALGPLAAGWAVPVVPAAGLYAGLAGVIVFILAAGSPAASPASFFRRLRLYP